MINDIYLSASAIAGIAILWRIARSYNAVSIRLENVGPLLKKQLACSICFIFWVSLLFGIFFTPLREWLPPLRTETLWGEDTLLPFLFQGIVLGTFSSILFYILVILLEAGNMLTERSHNLNSHKA